MTISSTSRRIPAILTGATGIGDLVVKATTDRTVPFWVVVAVLAVCVFPAWCRAVIEVVDDHRRRTPDRLVRTHLAASVVHAATAIDEERALNRYLRFIRRDTTPPTSPP